MTTLICNCNQTLPLDSQALGEALDETLTLHRSLCRREAPSFQKAARSTDELVVACTQERALFTELAEQTEGAVPLTERPIRFVNIREQAGWGREGRAATPKMAALLAMARLPDPDPVPVVTYQSEGRLLIIGPGERAEALARQLADRLAVSVLSTGGAVAQSRSWPVLGGRVQSLTGWLGAFTLVRDISNPIDLDLCTRCNACVTACPEGAIGLDYQVDLQRCSSHRDCVQACEAVGAIDFQRPSRVEEDAFDLVLDLRDQPVFSQHQPPQGYWHLPPQADLTRTIAAVNALRDAVGTFEKPRFFQYKASLCAHGRNQQVGCQACVDVCSASAIGSRLAQNRIEVNPHLCVGCGTCTTVCPTGALTYAYPSVAHQGLKVKTLLQTHARAGGRDAVLLIHQQDAGAAVLDDLGRAAVLDASVQGVPARVIPFPVWHTASMGLETWLSALALGASQVWVLMTADEAPDYRTAVRAQIAVAQAVMNGLGYEGTHLSLLEVRDARDLAELDRALQAPPARTVGRPVAFAWQADKRATLELALDALVQQAPARQAENGGPDALPLPVGAPLGTVQLDPQKCTLCMSCVGACPASALQDNRDSPQLRFIEKNCVQCSLCVKTCPEDALQLQPRLWLDEGRQRTRVLHQAQPYRCIRCQKPFGTVQGIEAMLGRLAGHAMFQGEALERLKMCGDCRVVDLYSYPNEVRIAKG